MSTYQKTLNPCQEIPTLLGVVVQCMQEEPTAQTCNFNYKKRSLLKQVIYYYVLLSFVLSTEPITIRLSRLGHEPWMQISNLRSLSKTSTMKFPSLSLCSAQLHILLSATYNHFFMSYSTLHYKIKYPSFISSP